MEIQDIDIDKESLDLPFLRAKVQKVVDLYISNGCKGKGPAYEKVYKSKPSTASAAANKLFKQPDVIKYIQIVTKTTHIKAIEKYEVTIDRAYQELTRLAYYNPKDFFNRNGELIPMQDLSDDLARCVTGFDTNGMPRWADKGQNLDRLLKALGAYQTDNSNKTQVNIINAPTIVKPAKSGT